MTTNWLSCLSYLSDSALECYKNNAKAWFSEVLSKLMANITRDNESDCNRSTRKSALILEVNISQTTYWHFELIHTFLSSARISGCLVYFSVSKQLKRKAAACYYLEENLKGSQDTLGPTEMGSKWWSKDMWGFDPWFYYYYYCLGIGSRPLVAFIRWT